MTVAALHRGGSGAPLLLLHGFTDTWRAWRPVLPALEEHHDVLAPTLPGHYGGEPFPSREAMTVAGTVDRIERQMDAAGFATAHVVGNSFGGWLAFELAVRGRARSVTAICPAGGWTHDSPEAAHIYGYFRRTNQSLKLATPRLMRLIAARPKLRTQALRELVHHPERVPPQAALDMLVGARGCSVVLEGIDLARRAGAFGELGPIDVPVRVAYGERDWLIRWPAAYVELRRMLPAAEFLGLPDCGHLAMWDDPALVVATILAATAPEPAVGSRPSG